MAFHAHKCDIVGHGLTGNCNQSGWRRGQIGLSAGRKAKRHQQLAAAGSTQKLATGAGLQVQETDCGIAKIELELGQWLGLAAKKVIRYHPANCSFM